MKSIIRTITLLLFVFLVACSSQEQPGTKDSKGNSIRLSDYRGKWVLINYWATWCKPCKKEIPVLNDLYQKNKDKLVVLGVSYDKLTNDEINAVVKDQSIQYPMLSAFPLRNLGISHLSVLPVTFIINPKGELIRMLKGPQTEAQLKRAVELK